MKKKLLFIEDQILRFDQAAGARASYMYLKLLVEMGISVTFIGADLEDVEPYKSHLTKLGIQVLTGKWFQRTWKLWFLFFSYQFDYVFFNRPHPTIMFIKYIEKFSKAKILYQCHDLHYLRLQRQYEIDRDPKTLELAHYIEGVETGLIRRSDVLLTFSQHEKETIEKKLPSQRTEVIPLFFYDDLAPPISDFSQRNGILYVGGFKHQPNTDAVLWFLKEVLPEIKKSCLRLVFYIVGGDTPKEIIDLAGDGIETLGYVTDEKLAELYRQVKLVVVPLRFGAGVKGKTVEAIHHSLPIVSTSIGCEGIISLEDIVPPTDTPKAFAGRVVALYEDHSALEKCSAQLHEYARLNLTSAAAKAKLRHLLNSLG